MSRTGNHAIAHPHSSVSAPVLGCVPATFMNHAQSSFLQGSKALSGQFGCGSIFIADPLILGGDNHIDITDIQRDAG
jgi:hypothetical protein